MRKNLRTRYLILLFTALIFVATIAGLTGCEFAGISNIKQDMVGSIKGCTYNATFYSNTGEKFMTMSGENIDISSNIVKEPTYSGGVEGGSWGYVETMSSVINITIDGKQVESCGSTIIFAEDGLTPDVDYIEIKKREDEEQYQEMINQVLNIESTSDGSLSEWTSVAGVVNRFKNFSGKPVMVVIQSQLGNPICVYSGNSVQWGVCQDIPKTTKLMIDGKALYIHRANFQIIDKTLLTE